jgi:hypothetical protein
VIAVQHVNDFLDKLEHVQPSGTNEYTARCPSHEDRTSSLSVGVGDDDRVLVNCFAGCTAEQIAKAVGLEMKDLFPPRESVPHLAPRVKAKPKPSKTRPLTDAELEAVKRKLSPIQPGCAAHGELEDRGLLDGPLEVYQVGDDLVFEVRGHDGKAWQHKRRFSGKNPKQRYGYLATGLGSPAWCSPEYGSRDAVLVVEGELNAAAAHLALERAGLSFDVQGIAGAEALPHAQGIRGREVTLYADDDDAGRKALEKWAGFALEHGAIGVWVLESLPYPEDFCDRHATLSEWLPAALENAKEFAPEPVLGHLVSGFPEIQINDRFLRDIAADSLKALEAANEPPFLFRRGGTVIRVVEADTLEIKHLDAAGLKGVLDRAADFIAVKEKTVNGKPVRDAKPARPPADLAPDLLARADTMTLPKLNQLASSPVFVRGGELVGIDGYHANSGTLLRLEGLTGVRSDIPVADALAFLRHELLIDFPFADARAGFAHTLAALFQQFVRQLIDGPTPLYLIEAPTRGSGKGLLCDVLSLVTTGSRAHVMVKTKDGDELEKRVTSMLLTGARVILLDNVHELSGATLAAALTATIWRGRLLGKSEMLTLPNNALWLATGNNISLDDDMPRRIIPIRLDPGVERPEYRAGFKHTNLPEWAARNRSDLVSACVSIVQSWVNAGMPEGKQSLGTYESWARVLGGILEHAGVDGFLTGRQALYETANAEPNEWAAVLFRLHQTHADKRFNARDALEAMRTEKALTNLWAGRNDLGSVRAVGKAMTSHRDRVFDGLRLEVRYNTAKKINEFLVTTAGTGNLTPLTPYIGDPGVLDSESGTGLAKSNPVPNPVKVRGYESNPVKSTGLQNPNPVPENAHHTADTDKVRGLRGYKPGPSDFEKTDSEWFAQLDTEEAAGRFEPNELETDAVTL